MKMKMAMFKKEINSIILCSLAIILGCQREMRIIDYKITDDPIAIEIKNKLVQWKKDSLAITKPFFFSNDWDVDRFIVYNKDTTLLYASLNRSKKQWKHATNDNISDIGGNKIDGKWHFFLLNNSLLIDRNLFKSNKYDPHTLSELSYIAHKEVYPKVVRWLLDGNYEVKEEYFQKRYLGAIQNKCHERQELRMCFDSIIIDLNQRYYDHKIDPKEIEDIKQSIKASVRPIEPKIELTTWEKIFGKEEKLFDSQEWKDYINQKSKSNE